MRGPNKETQVDSMYRQVNLLAHAKHTITATKGIRENVYSALHPALHPTSTLPLSYASCVNR